MYSMTLYGTLIVIAGIFFYLLAATFYADKLIEIETRIRSEIERYAK